MTSDHRHPRSQLYLRYRQTMNPAIRAGRRNGRRIFAAAARRGSVVSSQNHLCDFTRRRPAVPAHPPKLRDFRSFSSKTPPDDTGENNDGADGSRNPAAHLPFPWYHVPHGRIFRLDDNNDLSGLPRTARARFIRKTLAARELGVPWYQIFLTGSWERDLAQNFTWAFRRATAALLSKTFRVPIDLIDIDDDGFGSVSIDTTTTKKTTGDEDEASEEMSEEDMEETNALVQAMLEENLLALYQNLDPNKVRIKFKMQPMSCRFESSLVIPMFTRQQVKENPSLRGAYQKIEAEFVDSGSVQKVREMAEKLHKQAGSTGERALIAEVSIDCMESLQVYDAASGDLIQDGSFAVPGDGGEGCNEGETNEQQKMQPVQHLVRMEMVTSRSAEPGGRYLGSWQIIDWDDFLEGNVWH